MNPRFEATATPIPDLWVLQRQQMVDERGTFERLFCQRELEVWGFPSGAVQANRSVTSRRGTVRGLHFQRPPHAELKLVSCLRGRVFDVVVDLRPGPSFLVWFGTELTGDGSMSLLVPPGCAHGFQTLEDDCEMLYFHSHPFVAEAEGGIRADDPEVSISWPLPIGERSARDVSHPLLSDGFRGVEQ